METSNINSLIHQVNQAIKKLDINNKSKRLKSLEPKSQSPDFWHNQGEATATMQKISKLKKEVGPWQNLRSDLNDLKQLHDIKDKSLEPEISKKLKDYQNQYNELKKSLHYQKPYDDHDVILSIYAGAGGTDAQDWAQMLNRMYSRWAEKKALTVKKLDQSLGEEAGLKSITLELSGLSYLYGRLKSENGVHRLVRLSPFNSDNLRQTSFARVEILPLIEADAELQIDPKDLRVEVFRSGGRGGQSVNTTDSAVRITHIPTSLSVTIQNERSQLQNKQTALKILRSKLSQVQSEQQKNTIKDIKGSVVSAEWGNQIRNYILHPYKLVKDLRSGYESRDPESVLNGDIDTFIEAYTEKLL